MAEKTPEFKDYADICRINATENPLTSYEQDLPWEENNVTSELAYIFQDVEIFKAFLESVLKTNTYCEDKDNKQLEWSEDDVDQLVDNKIKIKTRVKIKIYNKEKEKYEKKEIDMLIEGEKFVCLIENKFGSKEHGQCQKYKEYILSKYIKADNDAENKKQKAICIFLDSKHSDNCAEEKDFTGENKKYSGYYLALYDDNILPILNENNNDTKNFRDFLKEVVWSTNPNIINQQKEIKKKIRKIYNKLTEDEDKWDSLSFKYGEMSVSNTNTNTNEYKIVLKKYELLELNDQDQDENKIKEILEEKLKENI